MFIDVVKIAKNQYGFKFKHLHNLGKPNNDFFKGNIDGLHQGVVDGISMDHIDV